ncbi:hypothetical protein IWQ62_005408, partial [Dispira parvispora]
SAGDDFVKRLDEGQDITLSSDENLIAVVSTHPGTVSSFSSWGPSAYFTMKPDITAPGSQIYSTLPLNMGGYGIQSGTSMASPYVAGCLALLRQLMPNRIISDYGSYLRHTANALKSDKPGFILPLVQQGVGLVDMSAVTNALNFDFHDGPKANWYRTANLPDGKDFFTFNLTLTNRDEVAYNLKTTHETAEQVTSFTPERTQTSEPFRRYEKMDMANISADQSTLEPGKELRRNYRVSIDKLPGDEFWVAGGRVMVSLTNPQDKSFQLSFPFIGLKGAYRKFPILPPVKDPYYPHLIDPLTEKPITGNNTRTFSMEEGDFPTFRFRLQFSVWRATVSIQYQKSEGNADILTWVTEVAAQGKSFNLRRNYESDDFYTYSWNGLLYDGKCIPPDVKVSSYRFTTSWESSDSLLKAVWTSPTFSIKKGVKGGANCSV